MLEDLNDELGLAKAWWLRSEADAIAGRWAARTEALERALVHAKRASDPREVSTIIGLLAGALMYGPTPVPEAIRRCEELSESVLGDVEVRAGIASTLAGLHAMLGQFDEARTLAEEARAIYEELGLRYMRAGVHSFASGSIELLAGDPAAAVRGLRSGYDELERMGERGTRSTLAAFLAQALVEQGDYADAMRFSEISEQTAATADIVPQAVWRSARAAALAQTGDPTGAEPLAEEAVSLAEGTDFLDLQGNTLLGFAHVLRLAGESERAQSLAERARQAFERKGNLVSEAKAAALLGARVR